MEREITYIGFYSCEDTMAVSPAAMTKMDYISNTLADGGYRVKIVSAAWSKDNVFWKKGGKQCLSKSICLKTSSCFGSKNKLSRMLKLLYSWIWLFFYLLFHVKRGEKVVVYHMYLYSPIVWLARKLKKFLLILEVEEVYYKIYGKMRFLSSFEDRIISVADGYLFVNDVMNQFLNPTDKPFCVSYGSVEPEDNLHRTDKKQITKLVYAGIIHESKGAFRAVELANYLDERYEIHILGYGEKEDIIRLEKQIAALSSSCKVCYDGFLNGQQYHDRMREFDIAVCPQIFDGEYVTYSFPSKLLVYLNLGLAVISVPIPCVVQSQLGDLITFYNGGLEDLKEKIEHLGSIDREEIKNKLLAIHDAFQKEILKLLDR